MEQFNPNTLEGTLVNPEQSDRQEALLRKWDSEALQWLEDLWDVEATRGVVSSLASHNPLFSENLWSLQNTIWTQLADLPEEYKEKIKWYNGVFTKFI